MTDQESVYRQMLLDAAARHDLEPGEFGEEDDRPTLALGRFRAVEDDEDEGIFSGDEGVLTATIVGAAKYGNVRVAMVFQADGLIDGNEVRDLDILEPV